MAVRIQVRRDTAANWVANNPSLREGEMGIEIDTLKIKIGPTPVTGDATPWNSITAYANLVPSDFNSVINGYIETTDIGAQGGVVGLNSSYNAIIPGSSIIIEGPTADSYETTLTVTDPTADRTITLPNATGTMALTTDITTAIDAITTDVIEEGSTNKYFSDERAQDAVATALAAGTHTNLTVTYNDTSNSISLAAAPGYVDEQAVDAVAAALAAGTHTNISVSYNDAGNAISLTGAQTYSDENAQDAIGNSLGGGLSYNDTTGAISVDTTTIQARVANVTDTEIGYLDGVTSAIQTQLNAKAASADIAELAQDAVGTILSSDLAYNDSTPGIGLNYVTVGNTLLNGVSGASYGLIGTSTYLDVKDTNGYNKEIELDIAAVETKLETDGFAKLASPTFTGTVSAADLTLSGNLTVNGTTTNLNSTNLVVEDKNIVLGDTATPTDITADGGGITLKGTTDKTLNWVDATDAWTSSEHINLASGKTLKYNGTDLVASQSGNSGKYLTTDGTSTSWGTVSGYLAPTLGSTSIASGATVTTIAGLTLTSPTITGTPTISGTGDFLISGDTNVRIVPAAGSNAYVGAQSATNIITTAGNTQTLTNKTLTSPTMTTPSLGAATATSINTLTVGLGGGSVVSNTATGVSALSLNTTGQYNTGFGTSAIQRNITGVANTAFGYNTLAYTTGSYNTAMGMQVLVNNTTGASNTGVGKDVLVNNQTGSNNTAIGEAALTSTTVSNNTAAGYFALRLNNTGTNNTAVGANALSANIIGSDNTAVGRNALKDNTTSENSAFGKDALMGNTSGSQQAAFGAFALLTNTTGTSNTAMGYNALKWNTSGGFNTSFGNQALALNSTGSYNTAVGVLALLSSTASNNTAVGYWALRESTGASNTALGYLAGRTGTNDLTTGSNNIIIGANAAATSATVSNEITLGSSSITTFRIPGLSISATTTALTVPSLTPTNAIGAIYGGTGLTSYTTGDILYSSATDTLAKLAAGSNGQILTLAAGVPTWAAAPAGFSAPTIGSTSIASGATVTSISGLVLKDSSSTTITANTATTVDTNALASFTTAKYVISIKQGSKVRSSEVIVQTDGTSVDMTEFGITETGGAISGIVVSASVSSTNCVLQVTITDAATTNATVKINEVLI